MAELSEVIHRFETAARKSDVLSAMRMATTHLGFESFSVTLRLVHCEGGASRVILSSLPRAFLAWLESFTSSQRDPALDRALESSVPFDSTELIEGGGLVARQFVEELGRHGVSPALYCPQLGANGSATVAAFHGVRGGRTLEDEGVRDVAAWITAHLHEALDRVVVHPIEKKHGVGELTRVERSMLELLARGYGAKEISKMLSVSPRAVRYYADRVREKLGARSLNHAMRRAIEARQVTVSEAAASTGNRSPRLVMANEGAVPWSEARPSFSMAVHEVRASTNLRLLVHALKRGVSAMGYRSFALVLKAPESSGPTQFVLTDDERVQGGWGDPGPLVGACLRPRPRDSRIVPVLRDDALGEQATQSQAMPELRLSSHAADGTRACFAASLGPQDLPDPAAIRRSCFRLVREAHEAASRIVRGEVPALSDGERLALLQMGSGATIRRIAKVQGQKERTLRYRVGRVAEKLGARNARHALAIATARGLVRRELGVVLSRDFVSP